MGFESMGFENPNNVNQWRMEMRKNETLRHWNTLEANQSVQPSPVPYKHSGSTYDQDGIRLTGTPEFIDSVLSRLKDLLQYENGETRLQLVYNQSTCKKSGLKMDSYNCYVQVHERGNEAKIMHNLFK
jgi:hypothetical protein